MYYKKQGVWKNRNVEGIEPLFFLKLNYLQVHIKKIQLRLRNVVLTVFFDMIVYVVYVDYHVLKLKTTE